MQRQGGRLSIGEVAAAITELENDAVVIRLLFTTNHLSRWLTPIHDQTRLGRPLRRDQPSIKELLFRLRDEELRVFPKMHAIATRSNPDLDRLPALRRSQAEERLDQALTAIEVMAEFRRLRLSTGSLLRSLPDDAWKRVGVSRRERDWTPRLLAEVLLGHDLQVLAEMDRALDLSGLRQGITAASRVHLDVLLPLAPMTTR